MTAEPLVLVGSLAFAAGYIVREMQLSTEEADVVEEFLTAKHDALEDRYTGGSAMDYVELGDRVIIPWDSAADSTIHCVTAVDDISRGENAIFSM